MERTVNENEGVIRWKKIGGGGMYFKNRIIKPGQIFTASADEIPRAFRDLCIPLDAIPVKEEPVIEAVKASYKAVPRGKSKVWFDVVDGNGKVLNEQALKKEIADQLVKDLER